MYTGFFLNKLNILNKKNPSPHHRKALCKQNSTGHTQQGGKKHVMDSHDCFGYFDSRSRRSFRYRVPENCGQD
jgi:hypothetical protein